MTRQSRTTAAVVALLLTLAGVAVACSSNSTTTAGSSVSSSTKPETTEKSGGESSETTRPKRSTTTESSSDDESSTTSSRRSTTTASTSSDDNSTPTISVKPTAGNEAFCNAVQEKFNELAPDFAGLQSQLRGGGGGDVNAVMTKVMAAAKQLYARMVEVAPAEIAADLGTVNAVIQKANTLQDMTAASKQPGFLEASERLSTWLTTNCGVNPQLGQ